MTPHEKELIDGVFERLLQGGNAPRDADAAAYIRDRTARLPDPAYALVQAVVVQELALERAQAHVAELENRLAAGGAAPAATGSFLSGAAVSPWSRGSVPPSGGPSYAPPPQPAPAPQGFGPWSQQPPPGSPGGGFLRNAATMAAGVAGGSLLADGILGLFGGRHWGGGFGGPSLFGGFGGAGYGGYPAETVENVTVNNYNDPSGTGGLDPSQGFDPGQGAGFDASGGNDGFDNSGGGFDSGSTNI